MQPEEVYIDIQVSGYVNEHLGKVCADTPISFLVGISEGVSSYLASYAHMV